MKETSVDIGKTYALRSLTGGEVQNANGDVIKTLEAGKQQHETAQESVWLVPDDCQVTKSNFKRAALALGLLGGGDNSGLPAGYKRVEWLEGTGKQIIGIPAIIDTSVTVVACDFSLESFYGNQHPWAMSSIIGEGNYRTGLRIIGGDQSTGEYNVSFMRPSTGWLTIAISSAKRGEKHNVVVDYSQNKIYWDGELKSEFSKSALVFSGYCGVFGHFHNVEEYVYTDYQRGRISHFSISANGAKQCDIIPALDSTGTPCMYDLVSRTPFYNSGTGDFLYPGKETTATTYSLRRPRMYAQMTKHGIRRLYHVPRGYNGTPEEYAEQNGFKILVETPQPEEGYWAPVWHDREDCVELEWVETEPPAEELSTID